MRNRQSEAAVLNQKYTRHVWLSPSFTQVREHASDLTLFSKSETLDVVTRRSVSRRASVKSECHQIKQSEINHMIVYSPK